jgi:nucleoside transporter
MIVCSHSNAPSFPVQNSNRPSQENQGTYMNSAVRIKLSVMMFLQYAIWGSWAVSMGGYLDGTLGFSGGQIGAIYATTAIAAMISPLYMGYLADRLFATEKMIAVLHLVGAGLLGAAAVTTEFQTLRAIMVVYAICYMPTLALTNSISFANISDPEKEFPGIRVLGTWGWIVAGWLVGFVFANEKFTQALPEAIAHGNAPIILAAGLSAFLGLFSFTLPHTPPRGRQQAESDAAQPEAGSDSRGGVVQLLADPTFLVFVICSFLICIPLSFYYAFANVFLTETDAPYPTALQTIGQLSEVGFMAAMPFFILRLGVKKMLAVGMLAWVARYFCFGTLQFPLVVVGLVLHGVCYDFFFVASQIYVDNRASVKQRASAQSFIAFVTMGIGMFVGNYAGGAIVDQYPPAILVPAVVTPADKANPEPKIPLPNWDPKAETGLAWVLDLQPTSVLSPEELPPLYREPGESNSGGGGRYKTALVKKLKELLDGHPQGQAATDRLEILARAEKELESAGYRADGSREFKREDLAAALKKADLDGDGKVSRGEWRVAQRKDWFHIWLWPAIAALVTCGLFWVGFRAPAAQVETGSGT